MTPRSLRGPSTRAEVPIRLLLPALLSACGAVSRPPCTTPCDPANPCAEDYVCGGDARCHLLEASGELAACTDVLPEAASRGASEAAPAAAIPTSEAPPVAVAPAPAPDLWPYGGTISIADTTVVNTPRLGHGLSVLIDLGPIPAAPPSYEETGGIPTGCKAMMLNLADLPPPGGDEGVVAISGTTGAIPDCVFVAGAGYRCVGSKGTGGLLAAAGAGLWRFTSVGAGFSGVDTGRHLVVSGASHPGNNGAFPIASVVDADTVIVLNDQAAAETLSGAWSVVAGAGPVPGAPDLLADTDSVSVSFTPGGGNHFLLAPLPAIDAGNAFTLNSASAALLKAIPTAGKAITLDCKGAGGRCPTGDGPVATLVTLVTTDGDPATVGPYDMPPPVSRQARISCLAYDTTRVILPAAAMVYVRNAAPTRIRASYARLGAAVGAQTDGSHAVTATVGHAFVGYTTPPKTP